MARIPQMVPGMAFAGYVQEDHWYGSQADDARFPGDAYDEWASPFDGPPPLGRRLASETRVARMSAASVHDRRMRGGGQFRSDLPRSRGAQRPRSDRSRSPRPRKQSRSSTGGMVNSLFRSRVNMMRNCRRPRNRTHRIEGNGAEALRNEVVNSTREYPWDERDEAHTAQSYIWKFPAIANEGVQ